MKTLKEAIREAEEAKLAIGHFNIANIEMFWAIVGAVEEFDVPVIIGLSEGERNAIGVRQGYALVESVREERNLPIYINADHSHSLDTFKAAVESHYDAAIIDVADKSLEENIKITREAREYRDHRKADTLVEGEVGYIGTSSKVLDEIPEGAALGEMLTTPEDAKRYVEETGVDLFAPAVGNLHGMLKGHANPALDIDRIREIREAAGVPLVLHGGSGITDSDFSQAIDAGISVIHLNTENRVAYRTALEASLKEDPDQVSPYKYTATAIEAVKEKVLGRLRLFNKLE